jgi:hypothetical protein
MTTMGTESAAQSRTGVTVLVAPGPDGHDERHRRTAVGCGLGLVVTEHRVVGRQDRAAAVTEYGVHAFVGEDLHDDVRASHDLAGPGMGGSTHVGVALFHKKSCLADCKIFVLRCNGD